MDPFLLNTLMIICFVVGSGLVITEAFIPGFGIAGISGIILEIVAIWCCGTQYGTAAALLALAGVLLLIGLAVFISFRSAKRGRLSKSPLILKETENAETQSNPDLWLGKEGIAVTSLRPAGQIEVEGVRLNAASSGEFIEKGVSVLVTGKEGDHCTVRRKN